MVNLLKHGENIVFHVKPSEIQKKAKKTQKKQ